MKPKCFVAMAFGRKDTDKVYDKLIKKAIKEKGIKPIRIDRKEYNADVDDEMLSEIQTSDLIISDLTYARPSVYFEAGYGEGLSFASSTRNTQVIYTCRSDHFKDKPDDEHGNYKVHFDLQMKNIITWKNSDDLLFLKKLKKRIGYVMKSILLDVEKQIVEKNNTEKFKRLSSKTKIERIFQLAVSQCHARGLRGQELKITNSTASPSERDYPFSYDYHVNPKFNIHYPRKIASWGLIKKPNLLKPCWIGLKSDSIQKTCFYVIVTPNISKNTILYYRDALLNIPIYDLIPPKYSRLKTLKEFLIICSINQVKKEKIMEYLPDFSLIENEIFIFKRSQIIPKIRPPTWKEVFTVNESGNVFEVIENNRSSQKINQYTSDDNHMKLRYDEGKHLIPILKLSREIHIKIIDNIKSENNFTKINKTFLDYVDV